MLTHATVAALSARLRRCRYVDTADMLDALAARVWPPRDVPLIRNKINALRQECRAWKNQEIQDALDDLEPHIGAMFGPISSSQPRARTQRAQSLP